MTFLYRIARDSRGGTAIEYGLIVAMLVVSSLVAYQGLSDANIRNWMLIAERYMSIGADEPS